MLNSLDISLDLSIGAITQAAPIDVSMELGVVDKSAVSPVNISMEVEMEKEAAANIPQVVEDIQVDDCGCNTDCDTQILTTVPDKPPAGLPPVFFPPSISVYSLSNPVAARIPVTMEYVLNYTKADAGPATSVVVRIDGVTVHTGGLSGNFTVTLSPGVHTATFHVAYAAGPPSQDTNGNPIPNPIGAGTLSTSITFNAILPFYSGVGPVPATLTEPQVQNMKLDTGIVEKTFWIAVHNSQSIVKAEDSNAMYLDLKGIFISSTTRTVNSESYIVYVMTNAIAYKTSHKFEFYVS